MTLIERVQALYNDLGPNNVSRDRLSELYDDDVVFIDPMHRIEGLDALAHYFAGLYQNLTDIEFRYLSHWANDHEAVLRWEMTYRHPKIAKGRAITLPGVTFLQFDDRIRRHQDYFDSNQMLFDHLPIIGPVLGWLKSRLNSD
ncbi:nuclear transport factor 2 family protein [Saccharospirillum mangrovi]|uniref:nuclear transport factor 2 family protein n=1 Tax=Saccharospirillum mangrovi TaxID=2161747 RepID=UPI000D3B1F13|nr:nuclear transport factor 2 family protein [Saccharospirillum mangrovi]